MRNQLQKWYYAIIGLPGLGRLAALCAPVVRRVAEGLAARNYRKLCVVRDDQENFLAPDEQEMAGSFARACDISTPCPSISIIINTCDRRPFLERALESAWRQQYRTFEIICVNGPSTDGTDALLERWKNRIKVCRCPERNLSRSRNVGIAAAGGEIVAFMDDDAIAPQDWLMELAQGYVDSTVGAVGGCVRDHTGLGWQLRVNVADRYGNVRRYPTLAAARQSEGDPILWGKQKYFSPMGTNVSFRRKDLLRIGGFDENYAYHLDETDVLLRLVEAGRRIMVREHAEMTHKFAPNSLRKADRTPLSFYHQARSKTYFILRHALPVYGVGAANKHIEAYLVWLASLGHVAYRQGRMNTADYKRLRQELQTGRKDGETLASQEPRFVQFSAETPAMCLTTSASGESFSDGSGISVQEPSHGRECSHYHCDP